MQRVLGETRMRFRSHHESQTPLKEGHFGGKVLFSAREGTQRIKCHSRVGTQIRKALPKPDRATWNEWEHRSSAASRWSELGYPFHEGDYPRFAI